MLTQIPRISVKDVGQLSFPLPTSQDAQLREKSSQAPFGMGSDTVVWYEKDSMFHLRTRGQIMNQWPASDHSLPSKSNHGRLIHFIIVINKVSWLTDCPTWGIFSYFQRALFLLRSPSRPSLSKIRSIWLHYVYVFQARREHTHHQSNQGRLNQNTSWCFH